jgi:hypothetical protein
MKWLALSSLAVLTFGASALATPIALPTDSPIYFQYNGLEQVSAANNIAVPGYAPATGLQGNWGVLNVSSIQLGGVSTPHVDISGGPAFFFDDGPGGTQGQVTGIFYGIQTLPGDTTATGGFLDLFWHNPGSDPVTAACLTGVACQPTAATVAEFTSGTFLARLDFGTGIIDGNNQVTIASTTNPTINESGEADGFASVDLTDVGPWTAALNGNYFFVNPNGAGFGAPGNTRDARFSTFYNGLAAWNGPRGSGILGLRANDPARVFTTPEPTSLSLLGLGLLGMGFVSRRKKNND